VGRLITQKGHADLLRAWSLLGDGRRNAVLVVLGEGSERPALEALAAALGLTGSIRFAGFREDAASLLPALDLLAHPSLFEGLPNAVLEAMAAGLPVVATAIPGNDELIRDGETGLLVPPGDPPALARALGRLLGDPALRAALGDRARARILAERGLEPMLVRYERAFLAAIAGR
jgi:glycosyltransferase involved in cell wall biosynthesis